MKVMKITIMVIDFDGIGEEEATIVLENQRYPNHCMNPDVMKIETVDIGEWEDSNPLNNKQTQYAEFERLFGKL